MLIGSPLLSSGRFSFVRYFRPSALTESLAQAYCEEVIIFIDC